MTEQQAFIAAGLLYGGTGVGMVLLMWDVRRWAGTFNGTALQVRAPLIFVTAGLMALTFLRFAVLQLHSSAVVDLGAFADDAAEPSTKVFNAALLFVSVVMLRWWRKR